MTATEVLRRMLDERGVEWWQSVNMLGCVFTRWYSPLFSDEVVAMENGDGELELFSHLMTPEQAIAATLRQAVRHPKPHEKWTTVLLPEIAWSWDDSWPDYLSVAHDTHGEWRTYVPEVTLGSNNCTNGERAETCEADETDLIPFVRADSGDFEVDYIHVMECTECGHVYEHVNGDYEYCPRCGRKREDVSE